MIFINAVFDRLVQVNDKVRIDVSNSFYNQDQITDITIQPDPSTSPISVFSDYNDKWFIDWAYSTEGTKLISVSATDGTNTVSQSFEIEIVTIEEDNLYSNDSELFNIETELKRYLPNGKSSFNYAHREAQERILMHLDRRRIWNDDGSALTKTQLKRDDVFKWSLYETASIIYTDLYVSGGDKFADKAKDYMTLRDYEKERSALRIDRDNSGEIDLNTEIQDTKSFRLIKR